MRTLLSSPISSSSLSSSSQFHHRFFCFFSSIFSTINYSHFSFSSSSISKNPNPTFIDYLINTLGFSKTQADSISRRLGSFKFRQNPDSAVHLFREFGFSETQIQKAVQVAPRILYFTVEKILKPKLSLFQNELGLTGPDLGRLISQNPNILTVNLERRLIPNINLIKKIIPEIKNEGIAPICDRLFSADPKKLLSNVSFLQSCGIVGDQLSRLVRQTPYLFNKKESAVKDLVSKAQDMGFSCDSRMLAHALHTLGCLSSKTLERKFQLLRSFGFSQEECSAMFRSTPGFLTVSEKKLKLGIDFFDGAGFERTMLVHNPNCLTYSLEKRVIPRFRVYQILKSKQQELFKNKCPGFSSILFLPEKSFLEKYIFKFGDDAEELLEVYYKGNVLNSLTERN